MRKIMKWSLPMVAACGIITAQGQQINPVTEAVMRNYAELLAENPKDYLTLYDRASQYLELGEYDRALSDIEMALEYTPESDKDYRAAEQSLKADILTAQKKYDEALKAADAALALNPTSQADLYKKGNLYILTNQPAEALKAFQALQRENPRSQEAFYGMAKANAMSGNIKEAEDLISQVESLGKQSYVTYCRIGDLYADMGNAKEATTNYAIAYTMDDNSSRPAESLKLLTRKYPAMVMETLDAIIAAKPDNVALNYLKAIAAFDGGMYAQAESACKALAQGLEEESPAVYRMMAMAQLAQNNTAGATESIAKAEKLAPANTGVLLDKAEILMSQDPEGAYEAAKKALGVNPDDEAALMETAKAALLTGRHEEAAGYLGNVILSNPGNGEALLLRGYLNSEYLNDGKAGVGDYTRAGNIQQSGKVRDLVYAALGKAKSGKRLDADGLINDAISKTGNQKDDLYMIAVYYAQTGNLEKAKEFADKAMLNGYSNLYNLLSNPTPGLNLQPIKHLLGAGV